MKIRILPAAIAFLLAYFCSQPAFSQELEYRLKAELIERFTRFIDWPEDSTLQDPSVPFVICIVGKNPFGPYLKEVAQEVKVKNKNVEILEKKDLIRLQNCQILFVANSEEKQLDEIVRLTEGKPVLTISDTSGFAQRGILINFYPSGNFVRFEFNATAIQKSGLKFSSRLLKLARFVDDVPRKNGSPK